MNDNATIAKLRTLKPALAAEMKIRRMRVFGSVARGEETPDSDVDILVDFAETPDLFQFAGYRREISERLGRRVDLVTPDALHPLLKDDILSEAIDV